MILDPDIAAHYRRAAREPLLADRGGYALDAAGVEAHLPHRAPMRLIDRVTGLSRTPPIIACRRRLDPDDPVFAGHFPGAPVYPGVLQVEAIGQAGILLRQLALVDDPPIRAVTLTHVRAACFLRPLRPGDDVEVVALGVVDGLFYTVVGQCLIDGAVASAVVASAML